MLVEDTVHGTVAEAPLINAALGITIRGAGLTRARGGMRGFWRRFVDHYRGLGGVLRVGCPVERVEGSAGDIPAGRRVAAPSRHVRLSPPFRPRPGGSARAAAGCRGSEALSASATPPRRAAPSSSSWVCRTTRSPTRRSRITSSCTTMTGRWGTATTCSSRSRRPATWRVRRPATEP